MVKLNSEMNDAKKNLSGLSKEEKKGISKALRGKLSLNEREKKIKDRVALKISGMGARQKLKLMNPSGVDKLLKEAIAEIEAEEHGSYKCGNEML